MCEFSLYPKEPLTLEVFNEFIAYLEKMASTFHENLYLVLSSVPVVHGQNEVTNHIIHIQCGPLPKIDVLTKINPADEDPNYSNTSNRSYSRTENTKERGAASILLTNKTDKLSPLNYQPIIDCVTAGGARFTSLLEICLDHKYREAAKALFQYLSCQRKSGTSRLFPIQLLQTLTSNSIDFYLSSIIADNISRADPYESYSNNPEVKRRAIADFSTKNIRDEFATYELLEIDVKLNQIFVSYPPFGGHIKLSIFPSYSLAKLCHSHKWLANNHNERVFAQTIVTMLGLPDEENASSLPSYKKLANKICQKLFEIKIKLLDEIFKNRSGTQLFYMLFTNFKYKIDHLELLSHYIEKWQVVNYQSPHFESEIIHFLDELENDAKKIPCSDDFLELIQGLRKGLMRYGIEPEHTTPRQRSVFSM
jgi:hypothetical protein